MTILQGILLTVLGMLILLGLCWALVLWDRRRIRLREYDERQNIERGNAYKISFWIGIVYYLVVVTLGAFDGSAGNLHFLVLLGVLIQVSAFSFCCLLTNAELPLSKKPGAAIASNFLIGVWFFFDAFRSGITLGTKLNELRSLAWIDLLCGTAMIIMGLMQIIQLLCREKE